MDDTDANLEMIVFDSMSSVLDTLRAAGVREARFGRVKFVFRDNAEPPPPQAQARAVERHAPTGYDALFREGKPTFRVVK